MNQHATYPGTTGMEGCRPPDPRGEGEAAARGTALPDGGTALAEAPPRGPPPLPQSPPQPGRDAQRALRGLGRGAQGDVAEHQEVLQDDRLGCEEDFEELLPRGWTGSRSPTSKRRLRCVQRSLLAQGEPATKDDDGGRELSPPDPAARHQRQEEQRLLGTQAPLQASVQML